MAFTNEAHRGVLVDFLDALDAGRAPRVSGAEALKVHRLIDALLRSSAERRSRRWSRAEPSRLRWRSPLPIARASRRCSGSGFSTAMRRARSGSSATIRSTRDCRQGFLADHHAAAAGRLDGWLAEADGALALVLLLDQIPRNVFRGSPAAWAADPAARAAARAALEAGHDRVLPAVRRLFLYLPFEHSERLADQDLCLRLFAAMTDHPEQAEALRSAERHREIIARFGPLPAPANAILGRASTATEIEFLKEPDSAF